MKKKVFNYSELHFCEGTFYKIHTLKNPEFDASYDPIVTESKGMLKIPEFDEN